MAASRAIDWTLLDHTAHRPVSVGDRLSVDAGGMPIYRVTALAPGGVWLEDDLRHTPVQVTSLSAFRWKGAAH